MFQVPSLVGKVLSELGKVGSAVHSNNKNDV